MAVPMSGFLCVLLVAVLDLPRLSRHDRRSWRTTCMRTAPKLLLLVSLRFLYVLCGGAGIFAILRIAFGS